MTDEVLTSEDNEEINTDEKADVFSDDRPDNFKIDVEEQGEQGVFSDGLLDENDAYELTASQDTDIIYILGGAKSGKTTFETVVYGIFHNGIDQDWCFADSKTLLAFEGRRKSVIIKDAGHNEGMPRTWSSDGHHVFLHLELADFHTGKRRHILLSDISGEDYKECAKSGKEIEKRLPGIKSAKHILIFLDAKLLMDKKRQQGVIVEAVSFLNLFKSQFPDVTDAVIDIVVSKADLIPNGTETEDKEFPYAIAERFTRLEQYFNIRYYWIETKNLERLVDKEHSSDAMSFFKELLIPRQYESKGRKLECGDLGLEMKDECNLLRGRWINE